MPAPIDLTDLPTPVKAKLTPVKVPLPGGPEVVFEVSTSAQALETAMATNNVNALRSLTAIVAKKDRKKFDGWTEQAAADLDGVFFEDLFLKIHKAVLGKA